MDPRQAKIQQLLAIEERKKRALRRRPQYRPRPGQLMVLSSKAKNVFNFSGNGGGKSTMNVQLAWHFAKGFNPWTQEYNRVPCNIIFVVDNTRKIEERIIPEFKKWFELKDEWLKRLGKPYTSRIEMDNGSVIDFYSSDADPSSFEGIEASIVIVDEPIPRTLYVALKRSLRKKGHPCKFIFSGTAISEAWLSRDIYLPWSKGELPDTECFRLSTEDNRENLADGYIEDFSRTLTEAEKEVRLRGGFFTAESLALAGMFDRAVHLIPAEDFRYTKDMPCVVAIDNHSVKPHHAVMVTCDKDDRLIVIKEMAVRGDAGTFAAALKEFERGYSIADRVCDSLGNMEMSSGEGLMPFIHALRDRYGIPLRGTTFKEKSHEDLIDRLKQGLAIPQEEDQYGNKIPKIRVLSTCTGLISDIESATWQKNRMTGEILPKLDTSTKDHLSCLGYALALHLFYDIAKHTAPSYSDRELVSTVGPRSARRNEILHNRARRQWARLNPRR